MINSNDSNSETNSRSFESGLVANGGSKAVDPTFTVVVTNSSTMQDAGTSSIASNDLQQIRPKRQKSNPRSWKNNKIKKAKAAGICKIKQKHKVVKPTFLFFFRFSKISILLTVPC